MRYKKVVRSNIFRVEISCMNHQEIEEGGEEDPLYDYRVSVYNGLVQYSGPYDTPEEAWCAATKWLKVAKESISEVVMEGSLLFETEEE